MNLTYQILYWRDIPAQVKVRSGRDRTARSLPGRFQEAIDEAAMRARSTSTEDYLEEWRATEWESGEGELEQFADQIAMELDAAYPPERLQALVANQGFKSR